MSIEEMNKYLNKCFVRERFIESYDNMLSLNVSFERHKTKALASSTRPMQSLD